MTHRTRIDLINELSTNLSPTHLRSGVVIIPLLWFSLSWLYVISLGLNLGPLRANALDALIISPQFAIESLVALFSGALFCVIAFQESIPGLRRPWLVYLTYFSALLWVSCYLFGLAFPALEPSLVGKRAHCVLEAFLYSTPPLIAAYFLIYRRFPLHSIRAGIFIGISAGMLPALFMQFTCLYDPLHMLTHHIGPISVPVMTGAFLGLVFRKNKLIK